MRHEVTARASPRAKECYVGDWPNESRAIVEALAKLDELEEYGRPNARVYVNGLRVTPGDDPGQTALFDNGAVMVQGSLI